MFISTYISILLTLAPVFGFHPWSLGGIFEAGDVYDAATDLAATAKVIGGKNVYFTGNNSFAVYTVSVPKPKTFTVAYTIQGSEPLQSLALSLFTGRINCKSPPASAGGVIYVKSLNTNGFTRYGATTIDLTPSNRKLTLCVSEYTGKSLIISDLCISADCKTDANAKPGSSYPDDPFCVDGWLESPGHRACCHSSCTSCITRHSCANFPKGTASIVLDKCCPERIMSTNKSCNSNTAPCVVGDKRFPASSGGGKEVRRDVSIGLFTSHLPTQLPIRAVTYGNRFNSALMYLPATFDALKWSNVLFYLNMQYDVHLVIEFMKGDDPLTDICNGVYDKLLVAFASTANTYSGQQKVYIRPLHEANAFWYAWGVFKNSPGKQKIPTYLAAYKRIVKLMRITAPGKFLFEQHYTPTNLGNTVYVPLKELYAGDAYVDRVTTSVYNTCGTSTQTIRSFIDIFNTWYYQITAISSKPIGIGEIGSTSYCGVDKSAWLTDAWFELAHKYTRVESIDWFLENKQFGKTLKDWDTNSPSDVKAFANGWHALKQATTP